MSEEKTQEGVLPALHCYAFVDSDGTIDLESLSETEDGVKKRVLEDFVESRWDYGDGNLESIWLNILKHGKVTPVSIHVLSPQQLKG
jgi:hypothetical protein